MKKILTAVTLVFSIILVLSGCSPDGSSPGETGTPPSLTKRWSIPSPKSLYYTYLSGDLYLSTASYQITAVDLRKRQVAFALPRKVNLDRTSYIELGNNLLAVTGTYSDTLTVFSRTGQILNEVSLPGAPGVSIRDMGPVVAGSSVYLVSAATLYKYRAADLLNSNATPVWQKTFGGYGLASLAVQDEDHLYVGTHTDQVNQIIALNGQGGSRWAIDVAPGNDVLSYAPVMAVQGDKLIAASGPAGIQAYHTTDGSKAWTSFPSIDICPGTRATTADQMTIAAGLVFVGPFGGTCVLAYHEDTGQVAWVFNAPNGVTFNSKPLYLRGVVYATNSRLWALDAATGKALAVSDDNLSDNGGSPLAYDPVEDQVLQWGLTGLYAYKPVK